QVSIDFSESHSHATALKLYRPVDPAAQRILRRAKRVVLIDDEISTGKTFCSLITALQSECQALETIDIVVLTDFSGGLARKRLLSLTGIRSVRVHALLSGEFEFQADVTQALTLPVAQKDIGCR